MLIINSVTPIADMLKPSESEIKRAKFVKTGKTQIRQIRLRQIENSKL